MISEYLPTHCSGCGHIAVIGGQCAKDFKPSSRKRSALKYHLHDQCASLFINSDIAGKYHKDGAYILTPSFLERWRQCIKEMGHDQGSAKKHFRKTYSRIVLLDTGVGRNISRRLQEFSKYISLPAETIPAGLDHFQLYLNKIILEWRLHTERARYREQLRSSAGCRSERREHERYSLGRTCLIEMNDSDMVELRDISLGGIRLNTPQSLAPDSVHMIKIFPSIKDEIRLAGRVVWAVAKGTSGNISNFETGIKFNKMDDATARSLGVFFGSISGHRKKHPGTESH